MPTWVAAAFVAILAAILGAVAVFGAWFVRKMVAFGESLAAFVQHVEDLAKEVAAVKDALGEIEKQVCPYPGGCPLLKQDEATRAQPRPRD